jgi:transmembrane sensor
MSAAGPTDPRDPGDPTPEQFAEAAAWIARLHGPNRTAQFEQGFQRWLTAKPGHAAAFEAMTGAWEVAGRLPQPPFPRICRWQRMGYLQGFVRSAVAVVTITVIAVAVFLYAQYLHGVTTDIGEQRQLTLEDGSRVYLNTATRILVRYDEGARRIELKRGEAQFDVAKNPNRPFLVRAGDHEIQALGTSFMVRHDRDRTAVTLVEGKVSVYALEDAPRAEWAAETAERAGRARESRGTQPKPTAHSLDPMGVITLSPGQRLTLADTTTPKLDEPPLEKVTAWRRGLVDFDNTALRDAIDEMNRYSTRPIILDDAGAADTLITGVFRAGDAVSFAAAVARAYDLALAEAPDAIHLTKQSP